MEIADTTVVVIVETEALDDVSDTNRCAPYTFSNICTCFCHASSTLIWFSSTNLQDFVLPSSLMGNLSRLFANLSLFLSCFSLYREYAKCMLLTSIGSTGLYNLSFQQKALAAADPQDNG